MILNVRNRNIRVHNANNQISYNSDYIAEFHFDEEWNDKIKTARFVQNGEYVDVVLVDDRCKIPPLKTGFIRVGVFTDSMTSTYADVYFKTSIKDGSGNPAEPPEDVYAQLTALIESGMLKGADGLTPYVGENNNWWIGDVDTGILARGTDGYTPVKGVDYFTTEEVQQIQNEVSDGAIGELKNTVDFETKKFNDNATEKVNAYNQNDSQKTSAYNQNATDKTADYNANADSKLSEYNTNVDNKVAEFNLETGKIQMDIANKLPKSPNNWDEWTAEEQAMARQRMGIKTVSETPIIDITLEEETSLIDFDVDNLSSFRIEVFQPEDKALQKMFYVYVRAHFTNTISSKFSVLSDAIIMKSDSNPLARAIHSFSIINGFAFAYWGAAPIAYVSSQFNFLNATIAVSDSTVDKIRILNLASGKDLPKGTRILIYGA